MTVGRYFLVCKQVTLLPYNSINPINMRHTKKTDDDSSSSSSSSSGSGSKRVAQKEPRSGSKRVAQKEPRSGSRVAKKEPRSGPTPQKQPRTTSDKDSDHSDDDSPVQQALTVTIYVPLPGLPTAESGSTVPTIRSQPSTSHAGFYVREDPHQQPSQSDLPSGLRVSPLGSDEHEHDPSAQSLAEGSDDDLNTGFFLGEMSDEQEEAEATQEDLDQEDEAIFGPVPARAPVPAETPARSSMRKVKKQPKSLLPLFQAVQDSSSSSGHEAERSRDAGEDSPDDIDEEVQEEESEDSPEKALTDQQREAKRKRHFSANFKVRKPLFEIRLSLSYL